MTKKNLLTSHHKLAYRRIGASAHRRRRLCHRHCGAPAGFLDAFDEALIQNLISSQWLQRKKPT
jgi:hypothetical protein